MAKKPAQHAPRPSHPPEPSPKAVKAAAPSFTLIKVNTHRDLLRANKEIFSRFNSDPKLASLLLVNPALAFKEVGIALSPKMLQHVMHTLQHPTETHSRRDILEKRLREALGEKPYPRDPVWVSHFLFEKLKLKPLETAGREPTYIGSFDQPMLDAFDQMRPPSRRGKGSLSLATGPIRIEQRTPSLLRLDLDAEVPKLKTARIAPRRVDLPTLFFYKDLDPLVHDALELGIIDTYAFPIQTASRFRQVRAGARLNGLHAWITDVRFPEGDDEPDK